MTKKASLLTWSSLKGLILNRLARERLNLCYERYISNITRCRVEHESTTFCFEIRNDVIAQFWEMTGGFGPTSRVSFAPLDRIKLTLPFKHEKILYTFGEYRDLGVILCLENIQSHGQFFNIQQLQEEVILTLAHELRHHYQHKKRLWRVRNYNKFILAYIFAEYDAWRFAFSALKKYPELLRQCIIITEEHKV